MEWQAGPAVRKRRRRCRCHGAVDDRQHRQPEAFGNIGAARPSAGLFRRESGRSLARRRPNGCGISSSPQIQRSKLSQAAAGHRVNSRVEEIRPTEDFDPASPAARAASGERRHEPVRRRRRLARRSARAGHGCQSAPSPASPPRRTWCARRATVSAVHQRLRRGAPSTMDVLLRRPGLQHGKHGVEFEPAVLEGVGHFVEHDEVDGRVTSRWFAPVPLLSVRRHRVRGLVSQVKLAPRASARRNSGERKLLRPYRSGS